MYNVVDRRRYRWATGKPPPIQLMKLISRRILQLRSQQLLFKIPREFTILLVRARVMAWAPTAATAPLQGLGSLHADPLFPPPFAFCAPFHIFHGQLSALLNFQSSLFLDISLLSGLVACSCLSNLLHRGHALADQYG